MVPGGGGGGGGGVPAAGFGACAVFGALGFIPPSVMRGRLKVGFPAIDGAIEGKSTAVKLISMTSQSFH